MREIYASKMYRASSRKGKIRAALSNPVNAELVQQLRSYLDEDSLEEINKPDLKDEVDKERAPGEVYDEDNGGASMEPSGHSGGGGYHPSSNGGGSESDDMSLSDILKEDELGTVGDDNGDSSPESPSSPDDEVSEAKDVYVSGLESTVKPPEEFTVSDIQRELNSNSTTEGVRRVSNKNSEIWIYYNDDVNLNTVMENVISKMEKLDDKVVEFNRLARTENAIVFQVEQDVE